MHCRWPIHRGRPAIELTLRQSDSQSKVRRLLADTGAGPLGAPYDLLLEESDCERLRQAPLGVVSLGKAYTGSFLAYEVRVGLPELAVEVDAVSVAVPDEELPPGFDGIASVRFLNRFTYGNFGRSDQFGRAREGVET